MARKKKEEKTELSQDILDLANAVKGELGIAVMDKKPLSPPKKKMSKVKNWNDEIKEENLFKDKNGGSFIPLSELLRIAHLRGIKSVVPQNISSEPEGSTRYAHASVVVTFEDGKSYGGSADSSIRNTDDIFALYPVCMAENRALARALRFGLGISMCSKEEISSKTITNAITDPATSIQAAQISAIKNICKKKKIKVINLLECGSRPVSQLEELTTGEATSLIKALNNGTIEKVLKARNF
jgi:hypothetical protein